MKTKLPQLEQWKARVGELVGKGLDEKAAVKKAIAENVGRYVGVLEECGYDPGMILDNLKRHGL